MMMKSEKVEDPCGTNLSSLPERLRKNEKIGEDVEEAGFESTTFKEIPKKQEMPADALFHAHLQNEATEQDVAIAAVEIQPLNPGLGDQVVVEPMDVASELAEAKADLVQMRKDLSQSRLETEDAKQVALKDALTGLPNRLSCAQRLQHGLAQAKRHGWGLAVFFIDVDNFKSINDSYGHGLGDQVLQMVAMRLKSFLRDEDMVSRWGGDEFVCLLLEVKNQTDMTRLAETMVARIAET